MNNKLIKKLILRIFLITEILAFGYTYLFGKNGIYYVWQVNNENVILKNDINSLKSDIDQLSSHIDEWESDTFHKEKIARETLQMSKKNDEIYYLI